MMSGDNSDVIRRSLKLQKRKDEFIRKCQMERLQQEEAELEMVQRSRKRFYHDCPFEKEAEKPIWDENGSLIQYIERKREKYVPKKSDEEEELPESPKTFGSPKGKREWHTVKKRVRKVKEQTETKASVPESQENTEIAPENSETVETSIENAEATPENTETHEPEPQNEASASQKEETTSQNEENKTEYEYEYEYEEEEETPEERDKRERKERRQGFKERNTTFEKKPEKVWVARRVHHVSKSFLKRQRKAAERRKQGVTEEPPPVIEYRSPRSKALSKNKTYKMRDRSNQRVEYSFKPDRFSNKKFERQTLPVECAEAHIVLKEIERQSSKLESQLEQDKECTFHPEFTGSPAYRERLAKRAQKRLEEKEKEKESQAQKEASSK